MKSFLKRANRGLILGAIVLVGFVVFVITDTIGFKKKQTSDRSRRYRLHKRTW